MTTANTISTLFGKMARFSPLKRGRRLNHRFLCPNCLHFDGFDFACGECWAEIPGYVDGNDAQTCPRCQRSLLSAGGDGVRAYCKQCKGNFDRAIYHQREVRVLATLRSADSQSLHRAISGQEYQPQGGKGYAYDDGARLTYVLNLSDFTDEAHSLPLTHPQWEAKSIWLDDVSADDPKKLALDLGEVADRFIDKAKLTEMQRQAMIVCVHRAEADPVVRSVLETHFEKVRYGVTASDFLCEGAKAKVVALEEIGHNSAAPALMAELKYYIDDPLYHKGYLRDRFGTDENPCRQGCYRVVKALVRIGKPAVPALIAALKDSNRDVRLEAARALGKIGNDSAVPALIDALKDSDRYVPEQAAKALVEIGNSAMPRLIAALKDSNRNARGLAAIVLRHIGDDSAVPALIDALKDSDRWVRCEAAGALGKIGNDAAVPPLIDALKDSAWRVRCEAARALGKVGNDSAVPALIDALKDMYCGKREGSYSEYSVSGEAAEALGKIGNDAAVPALIAAHGKWHSVTHCNFCNALRLLGAK